MLDSPSSQRLTYVRIADVADINPRTGVSLAADAMVPFVPMAAVSGTTAAIEAEEKRRFAEVSKGYTIFRDGDVIVAKITPCFENNKIAHARLSGPIGFGSTEFHVIRARPDSLDARYILHFLRQDHVREEGERKMTGSAGQRRVPAQVLANLVVPLPPLDEQRRIAVILDEADALRAKRRAALAQLDEMAQAIFVEMFGNPLTNPRRWPTLTASEIGPVVTGNTPSRAVPQNFGTAIEWLKSDNLNTPDYYATRATEGLSDFGRRSARLAPPNSILVTCIAGSPSAIGNSAMLDREAAFNQQINAITPLRCDPHYTYAHLRVGKALVQAASTAAMKGMVTKSRFERLEFMSPPREMQEQFAERALTLEGMRVGMLSAMSDLASLFTSLQHRAFRGEL